MALAPSDEVSHMPPASRRAREACAARAELGADLKGKDRSKVTVIVVKQAHPTNSSLSLSTHPVLLCRCLHDRSHRTRNFPLLRDVIVHNRFEGRAQRRLRPY